MGGYEPVEPGTGVCKSGQKFMNLGLGSSRHEPIVAGCDGGVAPAEKCREKIKECNRSGLRQSKDFQVEPWTWGVGTLWDGSMPY